MKKLRPNAYLCILFTLMLTFMSISAFAQLKDEASTDTTYAAPTKWETYYLMFLHKNPKSGFETGSDTLRQIMNDHIQYQLKIQAEGQAVAAGGVNQDTSSTLAGITLLRAKTLEEAKVRAWADPAVKAGYFNVSVRAWHVPAGKLPDRKESGDSDDK